MNPEAKKHYREVKNYIHNDLKITREDIRDILKAVIREEVRGYYGRSLIYDEARSEIRRVLAEQRLQATVKDEIKKIVKEELDRYEINLSIKKAGEK